MMQRRRLLIVFALLLMSLGAIVAVVRWQHSRTTTGLRIGAVLPLTGPFAILGEPIKQGMELASEEVNRSGGNPVEILFVDSQGDPKTAITATQRLIDINRVPVITTFLTGVSLAVQPFTEQRKVLLLAQTVSPTIVKGASLTIRMHYSFVEDGRLLAAYLASVAREPIGFIRSSDPSTSYEVEQIIVPALRSRGLTQIADERFDVGTKDFRPHTIRAKAQGVKQLCILGYGTDVAGALRAANETRMLDAVVLSGNLGFIELPSDTPASLYSRAVFTAPAFMCDTPRPETPLAKFQSLFRARYHSDRIAYSAFYAYDTVALLKEASQRSSDMTPDGLRRAVSSHSFSLMTGNYSFSQSGDFDPPACLASYREGTITRVPDGKQ